MGVWDSLGSEVLTWGNTAPRPPHFSARPLWPGRHPVLKYIGFCATLGPLLSLALFYYYFPRFPQLFFLPLRRLNPEPEAILVTNRFFQIISLKLEPLSPVDRLLRGYKNFEHPRTLLLWRIRITTIWSFVYAIFTSF